MRLSDIDHVEFDILLVLLIKLVERGNLPAKRRSSIASENENDWLRATQRRKPHYA
jgi:hypothetical protein